MIKYWLHDAPQFATTAAMLAVASVALAPGALASLPAHRPGPAAIGAIVVLGPLCTAAAYIMYFALIERAGAIRATVVTYVNPAVAVLLGVLVLHESMGVAAVAGLLLVVLGSWLSTGGPRRGEPLSTAQAPNRPQPARSGALSARRLGSG